MHRLFLGIFNKTSFRGSCLADTFPEDLFKSKSNIMPCAIFVFWWHTEKKEKGRMKMRRRKGYTLLSPRSRETRVFDVRVNVYRCVFCSPEISNSGYGWEKKKGGMRTWSFYPFTPRVYAISRLCSFAQTPQVCQSRVSFAPPPRAFPINYAPVGFFKTQTTRPLYV